MTTPSHPGTPAEGSRTELPSPLPPAPGALQEGIRTVTGLVRPLQATRSYIWLLVLAQFGIFVAFITPLAISLAVRVSALAPASKRCTWATSPGRPPSS